MKTGSKDDSLKPANDHRKYTLCQLCSKITDGTHITPIYKEKGIVFLSAKNIKNGTLDLVDHKYISLKEHEQLTKRSKPEPGDIMLSKSGSLGDAVVIPDLGFEFSIFESLALLKVKNQIVNPMFLKQYLCSPLSSRYFWSITTGMAVKHLHLNDLKKMPVTLPSMKEQAALVDLFFTWDLAIEKIERLIATKENRFEWLSCKLLFDNTSSVLSASERTRWFSVPDGWKIVNIGSVAKEVKGINVLRDDIPVLSCTKYDGLVDSLSYFGKQVFSLDTSTYKVVSRGEFVYATNHIEEGSIGYQDLYDKGLVSPMYTVFKTNHMIDDGYLYKVLKTETYRHIFEVNTSASVDRRGSLRWNGFAKLPIPLPPFDEQKRISATLDVARQEIDLLKKQAEGYRKQKRGLMQKLLTGEWRVRLD